MGNVRLPPRLFHYNGRKAGGGPGRRSAARLRPPPGGRPVGRRGPGRRGAGGVSRSRVRHLRLPGRPENGRNPLTAGGQPAKAANAKKKRFSAKGEPFFFSLVRRSAAVELDDLPFVDFLR